MTTAWPGWDGTADGISPLRWYALMHRAETIREHYPLGLASVWTRINQGDYHRAADELGRVDAAIASGKIPRRKNGPLVERPATPVSGRVKLVAPLDGSRTMPETDYEQRDEARPSTDD